MYQALYRKWRPKTFSEVVGQNHITSTLQRQVAEGHTAHAYLFTGSRGTGKTSCARILAKAVNCEHPVDGAPCCQCSACRGIDSGTLLDVTELDAASNNGVDQVRALREESAYTPAVLKKRVYIIDEVHMLSTAAFNALLKTLEEPPEHLLFILATTELQKVPATILSRCQRFSFKRILPHDIEQQLLQIAEAEQIALTADGAELLSRIANGAMRDALSLLDQCRAREGAIDSDAVLEVLGLAGSTQTVQLMRCLLDRRSGDALAFFDRLYGSGKDVAALLGELGDLTRDMTILCAAPEGGQALLTGLYDKKALSQLSGQGDMRRFLYMTQTLRQCAAGLADSTRPRTDAELCLLKLCDETLSGDLSALEQRVSALERGGVRTDASAPSAPSSQPAKRPPQTAPRATVPVTPSAPPVAAMPSLRDDAPPPMDAPGERVFDVPEDAPPVKAAQAAPPQAAPAAAPAGGDSSVWTSLLDHYKGRLSVNYRVFLNMATGILEDDCLRVICPNEFVRDSLRNDAVLTVLREVTSAKTGRAVRVDIVTGSAPQSAPPKAKPASVPSGAAAKTVPAETPPWEDKHDALDDLMTKGGQFGNFKIK